VEGQEREVVFTKPKMGKVELCKRGKNRKSADSQAELEEESFLQKVPDRSGGKMSKGGGRKITVRRD